MAAKGLAVSRAHGNGIGATHAGTSLSRGVAPEFDRSMNKASYVDDTPVPVIVLDCEHNIEYLNSAAALLAGSAAEACVGLKLWDVFDNEACRKGTCLGAHAIQEGRSLAGEAEYVVKGSKLPIRSYVSPRYDENHKIIGVVHAIQDNSEEARFADEVSRLVKAALDGQLRERGKAENCQGSYRALMSEINAMLDAVIGPLHVAAGYVDRISKGDIPPKITDTYNGDFNLIKINLNACIDALTSLQTEVERLTAASNDGLLSERGKPEQFQGAYADVVRGVNQMLDAILLPIGEGNRILAQISNGKIDELIAQTYKGDHEKMKQAVNTVAVVLQQLQKELARLTDASRDGQLSERGRPEQFQGAYAEIVGGVNQMLDAILLPIGEGNRILAQISTGKIDELIAQTYKGDHEKMKQAVNTVATVLQRLVSDTNMLTKAALEGKLSTRADASAHHGDFRKIVQGVNSTLDAVVGPMQDVSAVLTKLAGGDFTAQVTNKYAGDFEELANAVNRSPIPCARLWNRSDATFPCWLVPRKS